MLSAFSLGTFIHKFTILVINAAVHSAILALANNYNIFFFNFYFPSYIVTATIKGKKKKRKKKCLYNPDSNPGPFGYISYMLPTELRRKTYWTISILACLI